MARMYAFKDNDPEDRQYRVVETPEEATGLNEQGFGIFWTVNDFKGSRKIENLERINAWYVDLDDSKPPLQELLDSFALLPTAVVETKRGYHVYFQADNATFRNYKTLQRRLYRQFGDGDSVYDVTRLLRVPGYLHQKDQANPFLVKLVHQLPVSYTEEQMLYYLKPIAEELEQDKPAPYKAKIRTDTSSIFDQIHNMDQRPLLELLSGRPEVGGESYTFRRSGDGKFNILVNKQSTACWLDSRGRIGSHAGGGPSVWEWLRYYGYSHREVEEILKKYVTAG